MGGESVQMAGTNLIVVCLIYSLAEYSMEMNCGKMDVVSSVFHCSNHIKSYTEK